MRNLLPPWRPYFSPERRPALRTAIARWTGTPFRAHTAIPGPLGGVDCIHFVHAVLSECGAAADQSLPANYNIASGHHTTRPDIYLWLAQATAPGLALVFVPPLGRLIPGDILAIQAGLVAHHLALCTGDGQCVHAADGIGVISHDAEHHTFLQRVLFAARILQKQPTPAP
jgi:cell wall-associated NlpC family hydrolase